MSDIHKKEIVDNINFHIYEDNYKLLNNFYLINASLKSQYLKKMSNICKETFLQSRRLKVGMASDYSITLLTFNLMLESISDFSLESLSQVMNINYFIL